MDRTGGEKKSTPKPQTLFCKAMAPHTLAAVLPGALVEEAVDLRDLATLLGRLRV